MPLAAQLSPHIPTCQPLYPRAHPFPRLKSYPHSIPPASLDQHTYLHILCHVWAPFHVRTPVHPPTQPHVLARAPCSLYTMFPIQYFNPSPSAPFLTTPVTCQCLSHPCAPSREYHDPITPNVPAPNFSGPEWKSPPV